MSPGRQWVPRQLSDGLASASFAGDLRGHFCDDSATPGLPGPVTCVTSMSSPVPDAPCTMCPRSQLGSLGLAARVRISSPITNKGHLLWGAFCSPSCGVRSHTLAVVFGGDTDPPCGPGSQPFGQKPDCHLGGLSRGLPDEAAPSILPILPPPVHLSGILSLSGLSTSTTPTLGAPPRPIPSCPPSCSG